jgi:hypothetical protein
MIAIPKKLLLFSAVLFLPLYIDANHNDVGVMLVLCNGQWPIIIIIQDEDKTTNNIPTPPAR